MPAGLGIIQTGRINVYNTNTTLFLASPSSNAFCNSSFSFTINVQNTTSPFASTLIDVRSNGARLPTNTIFVTSTVGFPTSGQIFIGTLNTLVNYTGTTSNSFTGCFGGVGELVTDQSVTSIPLPPQGSVYIQDVITGAIPVGGVGILSPINSSNSRVTISPNLSVGLHNLSMFYVGQEGGSYDLLNQFKPSQSSPLVYLVSLIKTVLFINGPASFATNTSPNYNITVVPSVSPSPSVGDITLFGHQGISPIVQIGNGTPSNGIIDISIPANTFMNGAPIILTAKYVDPTGCFISCSGSITVNIT